MRSCSVVIIVIQLIILKWIVVVLWRHIQIQTTYYRTKCPFHPIPIKPWYHQHFQILAKWFRWPPPHVHNRFNRTFVKFDKVKHQWQRRDPYRYIQAPQQPISVEILPIAVIHRKMMNYHHFRPLTVNSIQLEMDQIFELRPFARPDRNRMKEENRKNRFRLGDRFYRID